MTTKHDQSKPRFSLIPDGTLSAVIRVLEFGASKYAENNWQSVPDARRRYYDAMHRHIDAWWQGEEEDKETGESHLAHAVCCAMFLMWLDSNLVKPEQGLAGVGAVMRNLAEMAHRKHGEAESKTLKYGKCGHGFQKELCHFCNAEAKQ